MRSETESSVLLSHQIARPARKAPRASINQSQSIEGAVSTFAFTNFTVQWTLFFLDSTVFFSFSTNTFVIACKRLSPLEMLIFIQEGASLCLLQLIYASSFL